MAKTEESRARSDERRDRSDDAADTAARDQAIAARFTDRGLHIAEDVIYLLTGLLLVAGALVMLVEAVYEFATTVTDGVVHAIEMAVGSLLIVFILVELLSAVRTIITERKLVAEPFLIVGILAAIKEMVTVATFTIHDESTTDAMVKVGVLAGVVLGLCLAILVLRRGRGTSLPSNDLEEPPPA